MLVASIRASAHFTNVWDMLLCHGTVIENHCSRQIKFIYISLYYAMSKNKAIILWIKSENNAYSAVINFNVLKLVKDVLF